MYSLRKKKKGAKKTGKKEKYTKVEQNDIALVGWAVMTLVQIHFSLTHLTLCSAVGKLIDCANKSAYSRVYHSIHDLTNSSYA